MIGQGTLVASRFSSTRSPVRRPTRRPPLYRSRAGTAPSRAYGNGRRWGGGDHIAAERYGNRFDGALGQCGAASQTPAAAITADFFVAAAYVAGVTQREFDGSSGTQALVRNRILPALRRPRTHRRFEDIMVSLTGGPRPFDRLGFRMEEETNWERAELQVAAGIANNRHTVYRLGSPSPVRAGSSTAR